MRHKRLKPPVPVASGGSRRRGGTGEIPAPTSLPPLVEGPLRCFLRCTVSRALWTGPRPPQASLVRLRWWGETSDGAVFQPGPPAGGTTARYPVRCGPRQFAAYLTDMGALVLEVMTKPDHLPVGRVQITGLSQLSPTHPIKGFFPIISPTSHKLGELQVSLLLEPLPALYDTSSSVPTTDASSDAAPAQGSSKQPGQTWVTIADRESLNNSRATTPRGKDHLLFQEDSENMKDAFSPPHHRQVSPDEHLKVNPTKQPVSFATSPDPEATSRTTTRVLSLHNPATKDLLSALLDQGNKLRDAMVISAMKTSPDMEIELNEVPPFIEREDFKAPAKSPKGLNSNFLPSPEGPHLFASEVSGQQSDLNSEERAIQLLLGSADFSPVHFWDRTGSLLDSVSLGSEVYDSEFNDPLHDQSLLESLFYTAPKSDCSLSDFLSDDDVNPSKKGTKTETLKKAETVNPQKDSNAFDEDQKMAEINPSCSPTGAIAPLEDHPEEVRVTSLSAERLALLGRIHLARVIIESLKIPPESIQITPRKKGLTGKPPRPAAVNKCTFFVEYHFPVGASKDAKEQVAITTEVTRVASSKITDDVVNFQQRFVFPLRFSGTMLEHWCSSDLAFKIFMRKSTQKKPVAIGSAVLQLLQVVQSELLAVSCELPVDKEEGQTQVGPLKVTLELAADNKDFTRTAARSAVAAQRVPAHAVRSPRLEFQEPNRTSVNIENPRGLKLNNLQRTGAASRTIVQPPPPPPTSIARNLTTQPTTPGEDGLLLHMLLMVPDGKDFVAEGCGLYSSCNVYLNCKLLSTEEVTRSAVMWGTTQPAFNFSQVIPFSLTSKRLERLKNNVMIIEAWNKMGSPGCDRLLGLVKLPLHQFYISFKDPKISHLLLQAQYPVVAVDSHMPVTDVFTGSRSGSLRVVLAMGSAGQIVALQRLKTEEGMVPPITQRPSHSLDPPPPPHPTMVLQLEQEGEDLMEHVFEIHVESVKGLTPLQSTVWGEADCYVQYYFPVQEPGCGALQGTELYEDGIKLKPFRTATALCVPDPIFHDEHQHSLVVPADVPVQRLLVGAFMAPGAAAGGIQFEVWCRYYYPNVRDQMVAKGTLPLSRLCAMVTMQHREEIGIQTFNLPLVPRTDSSEEFRLRSSGLLDVSVRYQRSLRTAAGITAQAVCLSVQIHRAAGLQAAARAVAQKNSSVQYYAGVGVNAYVSVHLSFLPEAERRNSRVVTRTFCPEFEHHMEFPCNLIVQKSSGEASCLGELLQSANIIFSIYHQNTKSAPEMLPARPSRDCLLGTVTIPTRDLLRRRSGISGWFPVTLSEDLMPSPCTNFMQTIVGGLELSVTFAHQDDRERVLEAAKLLWWTGEESQEDSMDESDEWEQSANPVTVTISTRRVWLPVHCVLLAGQMHLNKNIYCYLRYKLYHQEATWTLLKRPKLSEDTKSVTVSYKKPNKVTLQRSQGLLWFFREEKLEIQVWWTYGKENAVERPLDTDRLIGSAYVDLAALAERSRTTLSVSGVYPLFRCNAANLAGAALRVHIILSSASDALPSRLHCAEECSDSEDEGTEKTPDLSQVVSEDQGQKLDVLSSEVTSGKPQEEDGMFLENTFAVNILVERAMHLSLKGSPLTEREVAAPSSCVSFAVAGADAPITTLVIENTDSPVWDFEQQARLSKELLLDPRQTLVFKVWHKAETERVIGFASVDLSPLLSGFQHVCGWYNITDFSGQCRGQIKVAVSPLQNINNLKEERQARIRTQPPSSSVKPSLPTFPNDARRFSKQMLNTLPKEVTVPTREHRISSPGAQTHRHEEHVQNVRRFHESLQQAEGNTLRAAKMDSLSLSSRASLLTALRKNLSELDEVQRYFSQKLTRSFPDFSDGTTSKPSHEKQESDHQGLSREADPNGCHLLERSSQLVSQVSSLINDLQTVTKNRREPSNVHQDNSRKLSATGGPSQKDGEARSEVCQGQLELDTTSVCSGTQQPGSFRRSVFERHMLHKFLDQAVPEGEHPLPVDSIQEGEGAFEEYEEDVIEPRTLNEITTITDQTSPWSSVLSEEEPGVDQQPVGLRPEDQCSVEIDCFRRGNSRRSSTLSSTLQGDDQSVLTTLSPCVSLHADKSSPWAVAEGFQSLNSGTETMEKELFQPSHLAEVDKTANGPVENGNCDQDGAFNTKPIEQNVEFHAASKEGLEFPPAVGLTHPKTTEREKEENREVVNEDCQAEEESSSDGISVQSLSAQAGSDGNSESFSDDSSEESEKPVKPKMALSGPVVPNFFLPPQQMEASMRLLSISSRPSTALTSRSGAGPGDIPYRRPTCPRPTADLSEEETKRIARIFSAQLAKKE